ncbi:hypothetical protein F183_A39200 [Bryobacterales bacterium F-183]|nr:hypothetical protein F183_A39200 [Bryobacterales bacterium F-183]
MAFTSPDGQIDRIRRKVLNMQRRSAALAALIEEQILFLDLRRQHMHSQGIAISRRNLRILQAMGALAAATAFVGGYLAATGGNW